MSTTWLYAIAEPAGDAISIPDPPVPLRAPPRKGRCSCWRRLLLGLAATAAWALLLGIVALIKWLAT